MKKLIILVLIVVGFYSCEKEKSILQVKVLDSQGNVVGNAVVEITVPEGESQVKQKADLDRTGRTSSSGVVCFDYSEEYKRGSAGLFQLKVKATKDLLISNDELAKVIEYETTSVSIRLPN